MLKSCRLKLGWSGSGSGDVTLVGTAMFCEDITGSGESVTRR